MAMKRLSHLHLNEGPMSELPQSLTEKQSFMMYCELWKIEIMSINQYLVAMKKKITNLLIRDENDKIRYLDVVVMCVNNSTA